MAEPLFVAFFAVAAVSVSLLALVFYQLIWCRPRGIDRKFHVIQNCYNFQLPNESFVYEKLKKETPDDTKNLSIALMKRAMATIPLVHRVQADNQSMWRLRGRNMIRDSVYNSYLKAKQMVEREVMYIQAEAQRLQPEKNWGRVIFPQAAQLLAHQRKMEMQHEHQQSHQASTQAEGQ